MPETWRKLTAIVKVRPQADLFPIRAEYASNPGKSIGLNYLTSDEPLWFTLADCVAAKVLTGKMPEVVEAFTFSPGPRQAGLKPVSIAGDPAYRVNPNSDDLYKRLIEMRQSIKFAMRTATGNDLERLDTAQHAAKIAANATSYGIFVEVNVREEAKPQNVTCHGPNTAFEVKTRKIEEPGRFFHPLLATLITGAARLLLALVERRISEAELDWAFCDTDSMAIAKPTSMTESKFREKVSWVCDWFDELNPYASGGSLLKIENENFSISEPQKLEKLHCLAISAKRYVLFNLEGEMPVIRKVSSHGLGHLLEPYGEDVAPPNIPASRADLKEARRWHHDLWHQIIIAVLQKRGAQVDFGWHASLQNPAMSRYLASSPDLHKWFKTFNEGKSYQASVKPFNFMLLPLANSESKRSRIRPVAPYDRDHARALAGAFDRQTGLPIDVSGLQTYHQALAQYHLHPESKFHNGDYADAGHTTRRHVIATGISHIGKEADRWEDRMHDVADADVEVQYGEVQYGGPQQPVKALRDLCQQAQRFSKVTLAREAGISERHLTNILSGTAIASGKVQAALRAAIYTLAERQEITVLADRASVRVATEAIDRDGLRGTARALGLDPSNFRRKLLKAARQ